jgi:phosphate transport system substrate-binding protein
MRVIHLSVYFAVVLLSAVSCGEKSTPENNLDKAIRLKGSESEMPLLTHFAENWEKQNTDYNIWLSGGGTATGIDALIAGNAEIANASRLVTAEESARAKAAGISLDQVVIARDALAIITGPGVSVDSLSVPQLADLLSGKTKNWKEIGGPDIPVHVIGRKKTSGTYQFLLDVLHINSFASDNRELARNDEIREAVRNTKGAIGYVNMGSLVEGDGKPYKYVWVMSLYIDGDKAWSPYNQEAVKSGDYPLTRPLYQYFRNPCSASVKEYLRFELSSVQQSRLSEFGYFPLTPFDKSQNKESSVWKD